MFLIQEYGELNFIAMFPTMEMAADLMQQLIEDDRRSNEKHQYRIIERVYCPEFIEDCEHYRTGICMMNVTDRCIRLSKDGKEQEDGTDTGWNNRKT